MSGEARLTYAQGVGAGTLWLMLFAGLLAGGVVIYVAVRIALLHVLGLRDETALRVGAQAEQDKGGGVAQD